MVKTNSSNNSNKQQSDIFYALDGRNLKLDANYWHQFYQMKPTNMLTCVYGPRSTVTTALFLLLLLLQLLPLLTTTTFSSLCNCNLIDFLSTLV